VLNSAQANKNHRWNFVTNNLCEMERLPGKSCATCCTIFSIFCILILVIFILSDLPIVIFAPWADVGNSFFVGCLWSSVEEQERLRSWPRICQGNPP
jgi:hypothetical protein